MRYHIALYDSLTPLKKSDLSLLHSREGRRVYKDGYCNCGTRKFIVLKGTNDIFVVIGPEFKEEKLYYHKALLAAVRNEYQGYDVSGGGYVEIVCDCDKNEESWQTWFAGKSTDFGPFDAMISSPEAREVFEAELQMPVRFK